jgi:rod shape-determining protein MreC
VVTLSSDSRNIIGRGPPLGAGFFFLGVLSVVVMVMDHRGGYLEAASRWLHMATQPFYAVVQAPSEAWHWMSDSVADRDDLRRDNKRLNEQLRIARVKLLRFDSLIEENKRLRAVREASQGISERTLIAEIMKVDVDPFRHRVRIDKGSQDGVFKDQPVLDAFGIVGQVTRVDPYGAEIILISDASHAIPVQINRNGIRSIAVGLGDVGKMSLPYLTVESDAKVGDLLVSSGLDGIFPSGYPVATITKVERDPAETFAVVEAKPLAQLDRIREVLLLWHRAGELPADVATPATAGKPGTPETRPSSPAPAQALPTTPLPAAPKPTATTPAAPVPAATSAPTSPTSPATNSNAAPSAPAPRPER